MFKTMGTVIVKLFAVQDSLKSRFRRCISNFSWTSRILNSAWFWWQIQ